MSKKAKKSKQPVVARTTEPAWDKATWMSLSNVRLGIAPFIVAGALHAHPKHIKLTEAEVRKCIKDFLNQSL